MQLHERLFYRVCLVRDHVSSNQTQNNAVGVILPPGCHTRLKKQSIAVKVE